MMRSALVLFLVLVFLVPALPVYSKDSSFRCGNTYVDVGDSQARVFHHCGEPYRREIVGYVRSTEHDEIIEFIVESWTYDASPDEFSIITFKGNRVMNVETEKK